MEECLLRRSGHAEGHLQRQSVSIEQRHETAAWYATCRKAEGNRTGSERNNNEDRITCGIPGVGIEISAEAQHQKQEQQ
jgi:hypothetical protein